MGIRITPVQGDVVIDGVSTSIILYSDGSARLYESRAEYAVDWNKALMRSGRSMVGAMKRSHARIEDAGRIALATPSGKPTRVETAFQTAPRTFDRAEYTIEDFIRKPGWKLSKVQQDALIQAVREYIVEG